MKIFLDTANLEEINHIAKWGIIEGVTTNQKIFLNEKGCNFKKRVNEICARTNGPVSVELTSSEINAMIEEAHVYYSWCPEKIVIKVPMRKSGIGIELANALSQKGIRTNVTALMTASQAILAIKAHADYISFFYNRAKDAGELINAHIQIIRQLIDNDLLETKIIVGSIRTIEDVPLAYSLGAHIVTIPYKIICQMPYHAMTESILDEFDQAWKSFDVGSNKIKDVIG